MEDAIKIIKENIDRTDFDFFADKMNVSRATLYRKIKTMTGLSATEFIRNIRLKVACQLLEKKNTNISEVAYAVGFTIPKYFSKRFKKEFGITSGDYIKQYSKHSD